MRRVTKENLIVQIDRLRKTKDEQGQLSMYSEYTLQAFEMLLATMEAEPVAEVYQPPNVGICAALGPSIRMLCALEPGDKLYRHAQQPVVPDEVTAEDCPAFVEYDVTEFDETWARGFNACRAAMLNQK